MSRRKAPEPLTKVTLNLYSSDYEQMQAIYPQVGATVAVRELVKAHVAKVRARLIKASGPLDDFEIDVPDVMEV